MLQRHLDEWEQYENKELFEIIIVDDCSLYYPAKDVIRDVGIKIRLFSIITSIPWNQDGARNLAMFHAIGWCVLLDMDMLVTKDEAKVMNHIELNEKLIYGIDRRRVNYEKLPSHPNCFMMTSEMYKKIGGYDETFAGYYGSDKAFKIRLKKKKLKIEQSPFILTDYNGLLRDSTTKSLGRKNSKYDIRNNKWLHLRIYLAPRPKKQLNFEWVEVPLW